MSKPEPLITTLVDIDWATPAQLLKYLGAWGLYMQNHPIDELRSVARQVWLLENEDV